MNNPIWIENDEYHRMPEVSKTKLDMINQDPCLLEWAAKCPQDETKLYTFDFGDAMHAICLEPDRLYSEFVVMPDFNLRTNAGKAEKAEFIEANEGKKILTADEGKKLRLMFESVMANPESRNLIESQGMAESSWFWTDSDTGVDCRCRPDKIVDNLLVDIKTTDSIAGFAKSVDMYRYYVQDPFYCDGLEANGLEDASMVFLVIQKTAEIGRYPVVVRRLPIEAIEYGRMEYKRNLYDYKRFLDNGKMEPTELPMSDWFMNRAMEEITEVQI